MDSVGGFPGSSIEFLGTFEGFPEPGTSNSFLITASSTLTPVLQAGTEYFITVYPSDPDTNAGWNNNTQGFTGRYINVNSEGWELIEVQQQPSVRIIGTLIPATPTPTPGPCIHHGDVNFNGELTAGDAQAAFNIALSVITPTPEEACAADCNNDGAFTAGDAQAIFGAVLFLDSCVDPLP